MLLVRKLIFVNLRGHEITKVDVKCLIINKLSNLSNFK